MKNVTWTLVLTVAMTAYTSAEEPSKPSTLTPKEVGDGWLLLLDGESTFGWSVQGETRIENGMLVVGGKAETRLALTAELGPGVVSVTGRQIAGDQPVVWRWGGSGDHAFLRNPSAADARDIIAVQQPGRLQIRVPAACRCSLADVRYKPHGMTSIFNGKDLAGWKEFPGRKSKFSVADGVLTIKDGPGDVQTDGQWSDFVLQLDCKSNGTHLNSGVFFRCRPGEYQQGYEAQIRNQFTKLPTQEYTLEEYDPKTNELKEKRKAKYTAVDYGTGAIYRRQPARREVAKDHEWFTMTVAAQGRHIATWVNGIQVADWTDNRPLKDNARNGCRLEKGCISLQGHDPTTDLSFRNFRIAELRSRQ